MNALYAYQNVFKFTRVFDCFCDAFVHTTRETARVEEAPAVHSSTQYYELGLHYPTLSLIDILHNEWQFIIYLSQCAFYC